ncbi:MAG: DUF1573 domain-containing protein [Bacteroidetes bacterium]|nr:DUF1573 domain-containing protein [Bacteroidota bacterium]
MKKVIIVLSLCSLVACKNGDNQHQNDGQLSADLVSNPASASGADPKALSEMPTMDFADTSHDFGKMQEGEIVTYDFDFKNNGKKPLLISNATGSCGCTVPDWPHDPIKPGAAGTIHVKFNSEGKQNHVEKSVTISTNSERGLHMLYIKADINPRERGKNETFISNQ